MAQSAASSRRLRPLPEPFRGESGLGPELSPGKWAQRGQGCFLKLFSGTYHRTTFYPHSSLSHPAPRPQGRIHYLDEDAGSGERQKCLPKGPGGKTPICPLLQAFPTVAPMDSLGGCRGCLTRTLHPSCCPPWLGTSWVTGTLCWTPWTCSCCGTVPVGAPVVLLELLLACTGDRYKERQGALLEAPGP